MGFFSRKKVQSVKVLDYSLEELQEKLFEDRDTLEDLTDLRPLITNLFKSFNEAKSALFKLLKSEPDPEANKALIIGVNNSRRQISNILMPFLEVREPKDFNDLTELMVSTQTLLEKAKELGSKHGNQVSALFKSELKTFGVSLEDVADAYNNIKKVFEKRDLSITRIQAVLLEAYKFQKLLNKCSSYKQKKDDLIKNREELVKKKKLMQEKLSGLKESNDLVKANENKDKIRRLRARIERLKANFLTDFSDFSRAARKYVNNNDFLSSILKSLESDPLETIRKNIIPVNNLINGLLRSLEMDDVELKPKQLVKSLRSLRSLNPQLILEEYESVLSELKNVDVDENVIKKVDDEEHMLIRINNELLHLDKALKDLEGDEIESRKLIIPLKSKLEVSFNKLTDLKVSIRI